VNRLAALLERFRTDWRFTLALLIPNAAGIGYGYYYYWQVGQFDPASVHYQDWWLWPLVADSPNAVLLMSVSLVLGLFGKRSRILDSLAFLLMVYVGLWTTLLFLAYPERMGTFDWASWPGNANPLLFVSHMGMPLEAMVLVPWLRQQRFPIGWVAGLVAFAVVFVVVDYWGPHLHPAPFLSPDDAVLHAGSPLLMLVAVAAWAFASWPGIATWSRPEAPPRPR
jgi:uncharacterized membrane protein YpjA